MAAKRRARSLVELLMALVILGLLIPLLLPAFFLGRAAATVTR